MSRCLCCGLLKDEGEMLLGWCKPCREKKDSKPTMKQCSNPECLAWNDIPTMYCWNCGRAEFLGFGICRGIQQPKLLCPFCVEIQEHPNVCYDHVNPDSNKYWCYSSGPIPPYQEKKH